MNERKNKPVNEKLVISSLKAISHLEMKSNGMKGKRKDKNQISIQHLYSAA